MKVCVDRTRSVLTDAIASDTRNKNLNKPTITNDSITSSTGTSNCGNDSHADLEDSKLAAITPTNEKKDSVSTFLSSDSAILQVWLMKNKIK